MADQREAVFLSRVEKIASGCWQWSPLDSAGYGRFMGDGEYLAHRYAYTHFVGAIPAGYQIDHLCRNHGCVNPAHLEAVTPRENFLRGVGACARNLRKTHCKHGHPFSGENLILKYVKGQHVTRVCRECRSRYAREQTARRAQKRRGE